MPLLAAFIGSLIGGIVQFFAQLASRKITVMVLATASITLAYVGLLSAFNVAITPLVQAMFSTQYGQFLGLAFPPISGTCMAVIGVTWGGCVMYKIKIVSIKLTASS